MKISGTSLIPAATPTPAPFHQRRSGWQRSHVISAIKISSTWPRNSVRCTGSSQNTAAPTSNTRLARLGIDGAADRSRLAAAPPPGQPTAAMVTQTAISVATVLTASELYSSNRSGSSVAAVNTSAANGV